MPSTTRSAARSPTPPTCIFPAESCCAKHGPSCPACLAWPCSLFSLSLPLPRRSSHHVVSCCCRTLGRSRLFFRAGAPTPSRRHPLPCLLLLPPPPPQHLTPAPPHLPHPAASLPLLLPPSRCPPPPPSSLFALAHRLRRNCAPPLFSFLSFHVGAAPPPLLSSPSVSVPRPRRRIAAPASPSSHVGQMGRVGIVSCLT